jgi:hypothetical protein
MGTIAIDLSLDEVNHYQSQNYGRESQPVTELLKAITISVGIHEVKHDLCRNS